MIPTAKVQKRTSQASCLFLLILSPKVSHAPRILRLQYESQKPEEPLSYKANLIFCVGGGHEKFFVLFCLIVDLIALLILIRQSAHEIRTAHF